MRYELKRGVQLRAEDVTLIQDDVIAPERPPAGFRPVQHSLDLQAKKPPPRRPWEAADPRMKTSVRLEMPEELHMKLTWLKERVPNCSIVGLCRTAVEKEVERLLAEYDKPNAR